jgi:hypothetical protein
VQLGPAAEEIWRDVDNAAQVWEELVAQGCELSFDLDARGSLVITLCDLDGSVVRDVAAAEAAEIASAAPGPALDRLLRS